MTRTITAIVAATLFAASAYSAEAPSSGCFVRIYDAQHLAKHPDQLVTAMRFRLDPVDFWSSDPLRFPRFALQLKQRGGAVLGTNGTCQAQIFLCHVGRAPNGGTLRVGMHGGHVMMLYIDNRIQMTTGRASESFSPGKDDYAFKLYRSPERECRGMEMGDGDRP
jgi:hypothetical protein